MQVIRSVESHFSVGEMLRVISAVTNQDVNNDVFSKPDKMDEVMWQLVHIYFDMPPKPFKRIYLLVLLNRVCEDLLFPQPFYSSDFGEGRDKKKWMALFSYILKFIQFKFSFKDGLKIYSDALSDKSEYRRLCEAVITQQEKLETKRSEMRIKQQKIEQLTGRLDELRSLREKKESACDALDNRLISLKNANVVCSEHIDSLRNENAELETECETVSNMILQSVQTIPESIGRLKDSLNEVEADMHNLFETLNSVIERITVFQHSESILDQLKECLDRIYLQLDKYKSLKQQEKAEESELERDVAELKKKQLEKEAFNRTLSDLQNQSMRQKLLLANKKKVLQTKRKEFIKEIEAIKAETQEYQLHFNRIQQKTYHLEGDIKIGEVENSKLERQLQLIDKLGHHLADIHSILRGLD
ncbi:hypothetical protein EG68_09214 [Paragonimus skrjabini miyazakii]|uniref:Kinetochore protein Nuf2 n=1 Tax=Paragonimus skrjabini miyazakii TaxID=59628 RepID=A0A8S9YU68_9TREM|nr:hypothetical protein EG68_09214 [Paragonimus skrjabini miyazakii]